MEQSQNERKAVSEEILAALRLKPPPVPVEALASLFAVAIGDTNQSQAIRYFLFWMAHIPDPTGFRGEGALELRRVDGNLRHAALEVLAWWTGPAKSYEPLYQVLRQIEERL